MKVWPSGGRFRNEAGAAGCSAGDGSSGGAEQILWLAIPETLVWVDNSIAFHFSNCTDTGVDKLAVNWLPITCQSAKRNQRICVACV